MIVSKRIAFIIPVVIVALGAISLTHNYHIQKQNCEKYRKYVERVVITGTTQNISSGPHSAATNATGTLISEADSDSKSTNPIRLTRNSTYNELINQYNTRCTHS